jgi:hypothetical protein
MTIAKKKQSKDNIGLAGEFAVASELCNPDIYAQLTFGNKKRTDLLVEKNDTFISVEVKSKQDKKWPVVKGISNGNSILVLVDFQGKDELERPDFYVLNAEDLTTLTEQRINAEQRKENPKKVTCNHEGTLVWQSSTWKRPFVGMDVIINQIETFKEKWEKFNT